MPAPESKHSGDAERLRLEVERLHARITELERAEHERTEVDAKVWRLAEIVDSSEDAIIGKSIEGVIQSWNKGAERVYGYATEEMLVRPMTVLLPPGRPDEEADILRRINRGERIEHFETTRIRKDGKLIDVSLTISPIRGREGRLHSRLV